MRVLLIDNYDSFTYNLRHYAEQFADEVTVVRNDAIALDDVDAYSHIIISPGPGLPAQAGITMGIIKKYHSSKPILGVCLGLQAIADFFGATLYNQQLVAHGIQREVAKTGCPSVLLKDLPQTFKVGLYHSWAIDENTLPTELSITAKSTTGIVMALEHSSFPLAGVQFHPESIMTENGISIIENWLKTGITPEVHTEDGTENSCAKPEM